jgi:EpsI family protein
LLLTACVLAGALVLLEAANRREPVSLRRPLREIPVELGDWQGNDEPLEQRIVEAVGVDEYLNRRYRNKDGRQVEIYVGYYGSQRTGETIHSPKNCLPGAGWQPVRAGHLAIDTPGGAPIVVNEYLIEKGLERVLSLYWYQGRGRVVASEYEAKFWMVLDAMTRNRTDGALVRILTSAKDGDMPARVRVIEFLRVIFPHLKESIPG